MSSLGSSVGRGDAQAIIRVEPPSRKFFAKKWSPARWTALLLGETTYETPINLVLWRPPAARECLATPLRRIVFLMAASLTLLHGVRGQTTPVETTIYTFSGVGADGAEPELVLGNDGQLLRHDHQWRRQHPRHGLQGHPGRRPPHPRV